MSITTSRRHAQQDELPLTWQPSWHQGSTDDHPAVVSAAQLDAAPMAARVRRGLLTPALALWLVVYALLNASDLISTYLGLQLGLREANPLMGGLLLQEGFGALIAYKLVVIFAVIGGAFALYRMHPRAAYITVCACNILVFLAVAANVAQMAMR